MDTLCLCLLLLQLCTLTSSQVSGLDSPFFLNIYHQLRNSVAETVGKDLIRTYTGPSGKVQQEIPINVPFPCNVTGGRSAEVPDSIHRLRPGDIDVVAAMGDSLTAGSGAFAINFFQTLIENRGVAGNIGGEATWRKYLTLPNILKEFNPKLTGYAYGDSYINDPKSGLNVATIAAISNDMPFMANYLINKMKNDTKVDLKHHWKLITLFIGNNDICSVMCSLPSPRSIVEMHKKNLIKTLRILRNNLPRTFVAIQSMPHLEIVNEIEEGRLSLLIYLIKNVYCSCLFGEQYKDQRPEFYDMIDGTKQKKKSPNIQSFIKMISQWLSYPLRGIWTYLVTPTDLWIYHIYPPIIFTQARNLTRYLETAFGTIY
ncbi:phospholipase B1, membrane-associated-like isoform X2 [Ceratina calcarata]|uniref:Phospholipase B1, membrane-associated-like isoform X2 n=1 Tax=Ceratina calcarata TaxID=156304 RepID=A0AAJ7S372_9HYME|nr:phospholipase B1, membrane-associated-like isoform X2 [Ceratina calcarata]